jgi:predicted CXXCH cytochrome family protein
MIKITKICSFILLTLFATNIWAANKCLNCHDELANVFQHAPAINNCSTCHAEHGQTTTQNYRLKKPVVKLCQTCHEEVSLGHAAQGHPLTGKYDPLIPENNLSCVSCHNPHQSKMPKLIRFDYSKETSSYQGNMCVVCHKDKYDLDNIPNPPRNNYGSVEGAENEKVILTYKATTPIAGQDVLQVTLTPGFFNEYNGGSNFTLKVVKNNKTILKNKYKKEMNITEILQEVSKIAKDGDIVKFATGTYQGPLSVGDSSVKQFIIEPQENAGSVNVVCATRTNCISFSGDKSKARGIEVTNTSEDLLIFKSNAKKEFILINDKEVF